jgi:hypothetical protein
VLSRASESPPTAGACTGPANGRPVERSKQQSRRRWRSVPPLRNLSTLTRRTQTSAFTNTQNSRPLCVGHVALLLSADSGRDGWIGQLVGHPRLGRLARRGYTRGSYYGASFGVCWEHSVAHEHEA